MLAIVSRTTGIQEQWEARGGAEKAQPLTQSQRGIHSGPATNHLRSWVGNTLSELQTGCQIDTLKPLHILIMRIKLGGKAPSHKRYPINVNSLPFPF